MNVVLLVVDSLRACSLNDRSQGHSPRAPFLAQLAGETTHFTRAYATECWTLPTHCSMFTGLLASDHGAHFQTMAYSGTAPTIAELLADMGFHTEVVTRNSIFDGSIPGITRGFQRNTLVLSELSGLNPLAIMLALSKPRFRRQILTTGFFSARQRESRKFVTTFARATVPADRKALEYVLSQMESLRRGRRRFFLFCNLYDVHAPYPPSRRSIFRAPWSLTGLLEAFTMPVVLARLGGHRYLRDDFRMSKLNRRLLLGRYHRAIELMDEKLSAFFEAARSAGLLHDTLFILTSDHGEGFGEHGLYLHDASVYDTHLRVPLWIHHPDVPPHVVDDVVSTQHLFGLMYRIGAGQGVGGTILDPAFRVAHPVSFAEHFYYPNVARAQPIFRQNLLAVIAGSSKVIARSDGVECYDLEQDPNEREPTGGSLHDFVTACRMHGVPTDVLRAAVDRIGQRVSGDPHSWSTTPHPC